jgi:hypothetical protein
MSDTEYMIGAYTTPFKKWPDRSGKELTRDALVCVLKDAGMNDGGPIESAYFSNCGMGVIWDQDLVRGQCMFAPLEECGQEFRFGPKRSIFMGTYAIQACWHMWKWGHHAAPDRHQRLEKPLQRLPQSQRPIPF